MKIVDEQLRNTFRPDPPNMPWSNVTLIIAIGEAPNDCGVSIRTDDGSSELFFEYAPTVRECLETLADRWEGLAKALRERAANGAPHNTPSVESTIGATETHADYGAAIAWDIRRGSTSQEIRDEIISKVGMMGDARTPEMQARYDAAVEREQATSAGGK